LVSVLWKPLRVNNIVNSDGLPSAGTQNKPNERVVRVMEEGFGFKKEKIMKIFRFVMVLMIFVGLVSFAFANIASASDCGGGSYKDDNWSDEKSEVSMSWSDTPGFNCSDGIESVSFTIKAGQYVGPPNSCYSAEWDQNGWAVWENWSSEEEKNEKGCKDISNVTVEWKCACALPTPTPPVEETPTSTATLPVEESPTPTATLPVEETFTPTATLPVQETPTSTATLPVDETPTPTLPVDETPTATLPVDETPTPTLPVDETPTATLPVDETSTPTLPVEETPTPTPHRVNTGTVMPTAGAGGGGGGGGTGPTTPSLIKWNGMILSLIGAIGLGGSFIPLKRQDA